MIQSPEDMGLCVLWGAVACALAEEWLVGLLYGLQCYFYHFHLVLHLLPSCEVMSTAHSVMKTAEPL